MRALWRDIIKLAVCLLICGGVILINARVRPSWARPNPAPGCQSIPTLTATFVPVTPVPPPPPSFTPVLIPTGPPAQPSSTPDGEEAGPTGVPAPSPTPLPEIAFTLPPGATTPATLPAGSPTAPKPGEPEPTAPYLVVITPFPTGTPAPRATWSGLAPSRCQPCSVWSAIVVLGGLLLLLLALGLIVWRWRRS